MKVEFTPLASESPGAVAELLRTCYAELLRHDPVWEHEAAKWDAYDREAFAHPETVGACLFFTRYDGRLAGFGSWDPRRHPEIGEVGHNVIRPEFRGRSLGTLQVREILHRLRQRGIRTARTSTCDHPFFLPAQRMYAASGFREVGRVAWPRDPRWQVIELEQSLG